MATVTKNWKTLTIGQVEELARTLLDLADRYPLTLVTERDFYPAVVAHLSKEHNVAEEVVIDNVGVIDFRVTGTTNPAYLELAVARRALGNLEDVLAVAGDAYSTFKPKQDATKNGEAFSAHLRRALRDSGRAGVRIATSPELAASTNKTELWKLSMLQGGATKGRFLLLLDLREAPHEKADLEAKYLKVAETWMEGDAVARVVYAHRDVVFHFDVSQGKVKRRETALKKKAKKH